MTSQAIRALNDTEVFFAMDKGEAKKSDLVALRREICQRFITEPGYRFVELPDPKRAADGDYTQAVADWHHARASWAKAIETELGPDGGVGAFLAWGGDPSLYDSTLRILDEVARHVEVDYDVIPRHHRDSGADRPASHPAQRRGRTRVDHHRTSAAHHGPDRFGGGDARR